MRASPSTVRRKLAARHDTESRPLDDNQLGRLAAGLDREVEEDRKVYLALTQEHDDVRMVV